MFNDDEFSHVKVCVFGKVSEGGLMIIEGI